jgi:aspartyl-tRNA(Asn)/glutamyl-tRNA(Gln) amidotransferase subunit A
MSEARELELLEMIDAIEKGELTSTQIVQSCLDSVEAHNDRLRAFIYLDKAEVLDRSRRIDSMGTGKRGLLSGIPVAIKDLIDTAGQVTTQGSHFFRNSPPADKDAPVVGRLKDEGAIIFGKTNLHEFAWGGTTENPHFGICRSPWNPDYSPGGSSGGSAVAVAARMVPGALGTDTLGSIRIPSSLCGIVGLKPTYGLLPTQGIFPLGYTFDHVGPMARSVADVRRLLQAMLNPEDCHRLEKDQPRIKSRSGSKRLNGLKIARLSGLVQEEACHETTWRQYQRAFELAEDEGAEIVEAHIPGFETAMVAAIIMTLAQAGEIHHERLAENPAGFGDDVRDLLEQGHMISAVDYIRAQRVRAKLVEEARALTNRVDAWIFPTTPGPATPIGEPANPTLALFTSPINALGFPSIAIPSGLTKDTLPVSIQIITAPYSEYTLLEIAEVIEDRLEFPEDLPAGIRAT